MVFNILDENGEINLTKMYNELLSTESKNLEEFFDYLQSLNKRYLFLCLLKTIEVNNIDLQNVLIEYLKKNSLYIDFIDALAKPEKTIIEHSNDLVIQAKKLKELNYIDDEQYKILAKACAFHDIGKNNSEFQERINNNKKKFSPQKEVYHNILSGLMLSEKDFENDQEYIDIIHLILNHHHYCNNYEELGKKYYDTINKANNITLQELYDISSTKLRSIKDEHQDISKVKLLGLLYKCDYSASANLSIEYLNDFLNNKLELLLEDWKMKNSDAKWNDMQMFCKNNTNKNVIVIAQTGLGKTEGALNWIGDNKGFFFLPLQSAINAMYLRIKDVILKNDNIDDRLALLHSDILQVYNDVEDLEDIMKYYNETKQFSIPLNVSTIDQLFNFIYMYPGYELKFATLSYSKIVIDEIQMYDPKLLAALIVGLEKLNEIGVKFAIVTATLPPFIRELLTKKINFKIQQFTTPLKRHNVKVKKQSLEAKDIYNFYKKNGKNKKMLIVCNTIEKSQILYKRLTEDFGLKNVRLLHSKYIKKHRKELEKDILRDGATEYNGDIIWITTQIVEASLDIDFDFLHTELCDISSLFQRMGRVNRKGIKDTSNYNIFIYTKIDPSLLDVIIDKDIFNLSKEAILSIDGILSENDKMNLIEKYMTVENMEKSNYMSKYNTEYQKLINLGQYSNEHEEYLRNIDSCAIIPATIYDENKTIINEIVQDYKKEKDCLKKKLIVNKLMEYTLSIPRYKSKENIVAKITLSKYQIINVCNYNYNAEIGLNKENTNENIL